MNQNYHKSTTPIEQEYNKELFVIFSMLFSELKRSKLELYNTAGIFKRWYSANIHNFRQLSTNNLRDLSAVADQVISGTLYNPKLDQELYYANLALIDLEISKIRNSIDVLTIQANTYGMPQQAINERLNQIEETAQNGIENLATNTSILNTRELIFLNAAQNGATEYLGKTQQDNKVRATHTLYYENKWIAFDNPPVIGHIGCEINCRCIISQFR